VIFIVVRWTIKPEYSGRWLELVGDFTRATRAEPGNLFFDWSISADDPARFTLIEAFRDGEAGAAHVGSEHFRTAMAALPRYIAAKPEIINAEVPGDGFGEMTELAPAG
jgi:quinol monooxygenase YgiN